MSLCYDFQKWTMITLACIAITLTIGLVSLVYGQPVDNQTVNAQSDFYLEGKVNESPHVRGAYNLNIVKFELQGEKYKEICPSLQCKIDYKDKDTYFGPPDIPKRTLILSTVDFTLQDNITHADLGPKKKQLVEEYSMWLNCSVDDIVEENGQEVYYCRQSAFVNSFIKNKFSAEAWYLNINETYDAKNDMLKISGNFTGDKR